MPELVCVESESPEEGDRSDIPEDETLQGEVTKIFEVTKPFKDDDGNDVKRMEFTFIVRGGEYDGRRLKGDTSTNFSTNPGCRLRNWVQELMGVEIPTGFKLDTDDLIGSEVQLVVGQRKYKKDNEDRIYNFVKDLIRTKESGPTWVEEPF